MTILVKNESDIIADNIRYHANKGIDAFAIMDNGSTNGTLEILHALKSQYDNLILSHPVCDYHQALWMTQLGRLAKNKLGADFVICNDADEFWVPDSGYRYQDLLGHLDSVVTVHRVNSVFDESILDCDYHYLDAFHFVAKPIHYTKQEQKFNDNVCMQLVPVGPKVIVSSRGLIRIKGGNHKAKHWNCFGRRQENRIKVIHFPIRSREQFISNIENRQSLLRKNSAMGAHYK